MKSRQDTNLMGWVKWVVCTEGTKVSRRVDAEKLLLKKGAIIIVEN